MWLCTLVAFAALHEAEFLHEVRPFNVADPSALSNIELLIPISLPGIRPKAVDHPSKQRDDHQASTERLDHDEPFSSIPAYAFTLDTEGTPHSRALDSNTRALPKFVQSRSLYVAKLWPRNEEKNKEQPDKPIEAAQKASRDACRALARQQKGGARELLLYICTELMDVLASQCDCCDADASQVLPRTGTLNPALAWWGVVNGRREWTHFGDNIGQLQQHYSENSRPRPRVFV